MKGKCVKKSGNIFFPERSIVNTDPGIISLNCITSLCTYMFYHSLNKQIHVNIRLTSVYCIRLVMILITNGSQKSNWNSKATREAIQVILISDRIKGVMPFLVSLQFSFHLPYMMIKLYRSLNTKNIDS